MRYLHIGEAKMRTNIEIDDQLMREAMKSSGAKTKRATVEEGLRLLVRLRKQTTIRRLRGKNAVGRQFKRVAAWAKH